MSDMVERVSSAIVKVCKHQNWDPEAMARAAIEAMPTPMITPAMIEAGRTVLLDYDPGWTNEADLVSKIYSAMAAKQPPASD